MRHACLPLLLALLVGCSSGSQAQQSATALADSPSPAATASTDGTAGEDAFAVVDPDNVPDAPTVTLLPGEASPAASETPEPPGRAATLPNGRQVVPAGKVLVLGNLPFDCALSPDGRWLAVLHGGEHAHGVDLVDTSAGTVVQTVELKDSFRGLAWARDGKRLYVSGSGDRFLDTFNLIGGKLAKAGDVKPSGHAAGVEIAVDNGPLVADDTTDRLHHLKPDGSAGTYVDVGKTPFAVATDGAGKELGRIPTAWYPSGLAIAPDGGRLYVACAKGYGQGPRKDAPVYKMKGAVQLVDLPDDATLGTLTKRSDEANRFTQPPARGALPPIKHVVFVLRENRSYDQVLGDYPHGDGDPSLCIYGRPVTPNLHALAERFAIGDHFFCDGEVSAQGHQWAQGANASDAVERLYPAQYAQQGRWADASQKTLLYVDSDYLIERCVRRQVGVRVYGEPLRRDRDVDLKGLRCPTFKGWDLQYPDLKREAAWEAEFKGGVFPAFSHVWLSRDHTLGTLPGALSPRALIADNDAATGRLVDVLSHDPRWKDTLVIIEEDDAQGGYDHIDGHRSVLVLASPWIKGGAVSSRHYSQVSIVATVAKLLDLGTLSQYDAASPIIDDVWADTPDLRPFNAVGAQVSLEERNPPDAPLAEAFRHFDFDSPDEGDQALLARALWLEARRR